MIRQVVLYLTRRCNLGCEFCNIPHNPLPELSTKEWCRSIRAIAEYIRPEMLLFFGGEPFLRDDLEEIIDCANQTSLHYTVITNGTLNRSNVIKKLKSITLSIDCLPWQINSMMREGIPQLSDRSLRAFELLNDPNVQCVPERVVSTIANKYTVHFIPDLAAWMSEHSIWVIPGIVHTGDGSNYLFRKEGDFALGENETTWLAREMLRMKSNGFMIHNIDTYFRLLPKHFNFSWKCSRLDYLIVNSDGHLLACHDVPGDRLPKKTIFDVASPDFDYEELQHLYTKDVEYCTGCYYNHKIQLMYSARGNNVLVHI